MPPRFQSIDRRCDGGHYPSFLTVGVCLWNTNNIIDLYNSVLQIIKSVNMTGEGHFHRHHPHSSSDLPAGDGCYSKTIVHEKKRDWTNSEIKRIITLKKVSRTFIRGAFYIITILILISYLWMWSHSCGCRDHCHWSWCPGPGGGFNEWLCRAVFENHWCGGLCHPDNDDMEL